MQPKYTCLRDRLAANLDTSGECWVWTGPKLPAGYGHFSWNGRIYYAHRAMMELLIGEIPGELFVLHDCPGGDNPSCCNPRHLWLGTAKNNTDDMVRKGRHGAKQHPESRPRGDAHWTRTVPRNRICGENNTNAHLTWAKVAEIRARFAAGGISKVALGHAYGVSDALIGGIIRGTSWGTVSAGTPERRQNGAEHRHRTVSQGLRKSRAT